jgi:hypothetical protein
MRFAMHASRNVSWKRRNGKGSWRKLIKLPAATSAGLINGFEKELGGEKRKNVARTLGYL